MTCFRHLTLALLLALAAAPALAQQPPAQAPGAQAVAPIPAVSESHLAAARDVVVSSGLVKSFEGMVPQIADQIRSGYSRTRPEIIKDMEESLKPIIADLSKQSEQMIIVASTLYARQVPEADLKEIANFFKSQAGQKFVLSQPQILNDLFSQMQVFSQTLGNAMIDRLREDLRKKNITL